MNPGPGISPASGFSPGPYRHLESPMIGQTTPYPQFNIADYIEIRSNIYTFRIGRCCYIFNLNQRFQCSKSFWDLFNSVRKGEALYLTLYPLLFAFVIIISPSTPFLSKNSLDVSTTFCMSSFPSHIE